MQGPDTQRARAKARHQSCNKWRKIDSALVKVQATVEVKKNNVNVFDGKSASSVTYRVPPAQLKHISCSCHCTVRLRDLASVS